MLLSSSHRVKLLQDNKLFNNNPDNSLSNSKDSKLFNNNLDNSLLNSNLDNSLSNSNQDNSLLNKQDNNLPHNLDNNNRLYPTLTVFQPVLIVRVSTHSSTLLTLLIASFSLPDSNNLFNLHFQLSNNNLLQPLDNLLQLSFPNNNNNNLLSRLHPTHHSLSNKGLKHNSKPFNQLSPLQPSDNLSNSNHPSDNLNNHHHLSGSLKSNLQTP